MSNKYLQRILIVSMIDHMKLAVLTTDTLPHRYFCQQMVSANYAVRAFLEPEPIDPPGFEFTYAAERDDYEKQLWGNTPFLCDHQDFDKTLNAGSAVKAISKFNPDCLIVFGTNKLNDEIIAINPDAIVNIHSGHPEYYRGLDNDLWTCYHKEWNNLTICLHRVRSDLDTGGILKTVQIPLHRDMEIAHLRIAKAQATVTATLDEIDRFDELGKFTFKKQDQRYSRYYGHMPSTLHELTNKRLITFCEAKYQRGELT